MGCASSGAVPWSGVITSKGAVEPQRNDIYVAGVGVIRGQTPASQYFIIENDAGRLSSCDVSRATWQAFNKGDKVTCHPPSGWSRQSLVVSIGEGH